SVGAVSLKTAPHLRQPRLKPPPTPPPPQLPVFPLPPPPPTPPPPPAVGPPSEPVGFHGSSASFSISGNFLTLRLTLKVTWPLPSRGSGLTKLVMSTLPAK